MNDYRDGGNNVEHSYHKDMIMSCGTGGYVDLSNTPSNGTTLVRATVDTTGLTSPMVKIDFNSILSYRLSMLEELDLIFTLYRSGHKGEMTELATWPYKVLMDQTLTDTENEQYVYVILEKNESFNVSFCDNLNCTGHYTYIMKVETNYFDITNAVIQSGFISLIAQSNCN